MTKRKEEAINLASIKNIDQEKECERKKSKLDNQCEFFMEKKGRRCRMQKKSGRIYCSEHMIFDKSNGNDRIPCPYDNNHTVWVEELQYHLRKCNARPKEINEDWYSRDFNVALDKNPTNENYSGNLAEDMDKCINILQKFKDKTRSLELRVNIHNGLSSRLKEVLNKKYVMQQASLIGNMKDLGLLSPEVFYLEFGCGKAELSRYVGLCIQKDLNSGEGGDHPSYGFGLIDRGVNRMKMDSKIRTDAQEGKYPLSPRIKRTRIDIKDINLEAFLKDVDHDEIVVISKHLCGAATDLTFNLLVNSSLLQPGSKLRGLTIAMCCRHACCYESLLPQSKKYLRSMGIEKASDFNSLKRIASWALSGSRGTPKSESNHDENLLSGDEMEQLGLSARRLIDDSRVAGLNDILREKGFEADMFLYVDKEVTLENSCIYIKRK